jgi:hypothetical protein
MDYNGKRLDLTMRVYGKKVDTYSAAIGKEINWIVERNDAVPSNYLEKYKGNTATFLVEGNDIVFPSLHNEHTMYFHFQDENTLVGYRDDYPNALWVLHRAKKVAK